jgi:hypothetical protein
LNPPPADESKVENILKQYKQKLREAEANPGRQLVKDSFYSVNITAAKYGIKECTL